MTRFVLSVTTCFIAFTVLAQTNPSALGARAWRLQNERAIVDEFMDFLRLPNVTGDSANARRNALFIEKMLVKRGATVRVISADGANPLVVGRILTPGATRTLALYAHYDGQPLREREWASPPFTPTLRAQTNGEMGAVLPLPPAGARFDPESRIYARSAGDDKAPIMAMVAALDAISSRGMRLRSNITFVFEGEEEDGSPNLARLLAANRTLCEADVWLICDGPLHSTRRPLLYFGARDVLRMDLTVYGARRELHSGHYGNWAPNPAMLLARLLASMKEENGRVLVDRFYDDVEPLSEMEQQAIALAPDVDADLSHELWLGSTEGAPAKLAELVTRPSLNIRGMASARVGAEGSNVIPSTATASLDIRLVKGMRPLRTQEEVIEHIRRQGFFVVDSVPSPEIRRAHAKVIRIEKGIPGPGAVRTPMDLPIAREVVGVVESVLGPAVKLPNMGGALPLAEIEQTLGTRTIVVPIANHDDNQHTFNENLRLQNLWDGIEVMAALLTM